MDFMDLLLAEALAAGMARQAAEARQRPPPDNFFILPPDPQVPYNYTDSIYHYKILQDSNNYNQEIDSTSIYYSSTISCARVSSC